MASKSEILPSSNSSCKRWTWSAKDILGRGGFSEVYKGKWLSTSCAVKMFRPSENVKISESFVKKECEIWSKLNHDHITDLYEVVEEKDNPYPVLILKLMDTSLRKFLERNSEFPLRSKFRILLQVARALVYLHDKGYTHGDLTANNVLLQLEGRYILAQLSDFGMSRVAEEDIHGNLTTNTAGVAAYMAPEVIDGQPVMASDIYSFGVLIIHTVIQKFPKQCHATRKDGPNAQLTALTEYQRFERDINVFSEEAKKHLDNFVFICLENVPSCRPSAMNLVKKMESQVDGIPNYQSPDWPQQATSIVQNHFEDSVCITGLQSENSQLILGKMTKVGQPMLQESAECPPKRVKSNQHRPEIKLPSAKREDSEESYNPSIPDSEATSESETVNDKSDSDFEEEGNLSNEDSEESCTSLIQDSEATHEEEMTENQHETEDKEKPNASTAYSWKDCPPLPGPVDNVVISGDYLYAAISLDNGSEIRRLNIKTLNWDKECISKISTVKFTLVAARNILFRIGGRKSHPGLKNRHHKKVVWELKEGSAILALDLSKGVPSSEWEKLPQMNHGYINPVACCFEDYLVVVGDKTLEIIHVIKRKAWKCVARPPVAPHPYLTVWAGNLILGPIVWPSASYREDQNQHFAFPVELLKRAADDEQKELEYNYWKNSSFEATIKLCLNPARFLSFDDKLLILDVTEEHSPILPIIQKRPIIYCLNGQVIHCIRPPQSVSYPDTFVVKNPWKLSDLPFPRVAASVTENGEVNIFLFMQWSCVIGTFRINNMRRKS